MCVQDYILGGLNHSFSPFAGFSFAVYFYQQQPAVSSLLYPPRTPSSDILLLPHRESPSISPLLLTTSSALPIATPPLPQRHVSLPEIPRSHAILPPLHRALQSRQHRRRNPHFRALLALAGARRRRQDPDGAVSPLVSVCGGRRGGAGYLAPEAAEGACRCLLEVFGRGEQDGERYLVGAPS